MNKFSKIILIVVVLLAAFLRLYQINDVPPGVNRDEASIGFTAYSLLKTAKDEYGKFLPLSFQSFGDWKLPLYIYVTIPFVAVLGMTELAVRLPSTIAGILTVLVVFFLVRELIPKHFHRDMLAAISAAVIAISPWHIHLSRVESESNIAVFCITLGTLLFFRAIKGSVKLLPAAAILLALTFYIYHGNHVFTSLFVCGLVGLYWNQLKSISTAKVASVIFLGLVGIILTQTLHSADKTKISGISIFGDPTVVHSNIELARTEHDTPEGLRGKLTHNRVVYAATTVWNNYIKAFSPEFLFIKGGGNHAHNIEGFGNMYPIEAIFLLFGVVAIFATRKEKSSQLLLWWLTISPVAASITKDAPHTNRMFAVFPALSIIVAYGILTLITEWKSLFVRKVAIILVIALYVCSLGSYLDRYYAHFPRNEAQHWGYGYKKIAAVVNQPKNKSKQIIMSHPEYSPYIFLLFYSGYDPRLYQNQATRYPLTQDAFSHVKGFGRFTFRPIDWGRDMAEPNTIIIDLVENIPQSIKDTPHFSKIILPNATELWGIVYTSIL